MINSFAFYEIYVKFFLLGDFEDYLSFYEDYVGILLFRYTFAFKFDRFPFVLVEYGGL